VQRWGGALKRWLGWAVLIEWGGGSFGISFGERVDSLFSWCTATPKTSTDERISAFELRGLVFGRVLVFVAAARKIK
jgi:hypothetical protein